MIVAPREDAHLGDLREVTREEAPNRTRADDADAPDHAAYLLFR